MKNSTFYAVLPSEQSRMSRESVFDIMLHWRLLRDAGLAIVTCHAVSQAAWLEEPRSPERLLTGFSSFRVRMVGSMSMTKSPETRDSLLLRIRDSRNREAWYEFVSIYQPLIYRVGRYHGLQDADAQNLTQEVLQKVERKTGDWNPGQAQGSFRRWLVTVAKNTAIDAIRRAAADAARGGTSVGEVVQDIPGQEGASEATFRLELERQAFRWAARRIRDEFTEATWTAFWQTMVEGEACAEVADRLGRSIGAVYTARSRVVQRLKKEIQNFGWDSEEPQSEQT